jgi:hypothetical protein
LHHQSCELPTFLFIPLDDISKIWTLPNLAISVEPGDPHFPYFEPENVANLVGRFGDGLAAVTPRPTLHQGLVVMEIMRSYYSREVVYLNYDQFARTFLEHGARHSLLGSRPLVVFLLQTTDENSSWTKLQRIFLELNVLVLKYPVRTYPSWSEALWDGRKLGDIEVLDEIALNAEYEQFQYRPKTCSGSGPCVLDDHARTVQKRSTSSGGHGVTVITGLTRYLRCQANDNPSTLKQQRSGSSVYFHQELVESLLLGEFRVFLVWNSELNKPRIVHTIKTSWINGEICALSVTDTDFYWKNFATSQQELHRFAAFIHSSLCNRPDVNDHFESLKVGVRLDIGISADGRFFVNEITRWYGADFFSMTTLGPPCTQLCSIYATQLHRYFS